MFYYLTDAGQVLQEFNTQVIKKAGLKRFLSQTQINHDKKGLKQQRA